MDYFDIAAGFEVRPAAGRIVVASPDQSVRLADSGNRQRDSAGPD